MTDGDAKMNISTGFTVHGAKLVAASSTRTMGGPLKLHLHNEDGCGAEIIIFTDDQAYTDALIEAINGVNAARDAAKVVAFDTEAA